MASNGFAIVGLGHYAETSRVDSRVGVEGVSGWVLWSSFPGRLLRCWRGRRVGGRCRWLELLINSVVGELDLETRVELYLRLYEAYARGARELSRKGDLL